MSIVLIDIGVGVGGGVGARVKSCLQIFFRSSGWRGRHCHHTKDTNYKPSTIQ